VAAQYVDAIDAVRAAVTEPANYSGTWTPLPNVTWSDTVAASAQAWATNLATTQNCGLTHESQKTYGENLAMGTNLTPQGAVNLWAGEKNLYTYSAKYSQADFNAGSGHYTQLVWRTSIQVGCGSATCSGNVVVISCRFLPPGNYIGQPVY
jgi:pathogenesis-related protein 1